MTTPSDIIAAAESVHEKIIQDGPESSIHHIAEALKAERDGQWQDIATAPTDGEWVSVYWPTMPISIYPKTAFNCGDKYGWETPDDFGQVFPTHWRPLPPPPTDKQEG